MFVIQRSTTGVGNPDLLNTNKSVGKVVDGLTDLWHVFGCFHHPPQLNVRGICHRVDFRFLCTWILGSLCCVFFGIPSKSPFSDFKLP